MFCFLALNNQVAVDKKASVETPLIPSPKVKRKINKSFTLHSSGARVNQLYLAAF